MLSVVIPVYRDAANALALLAALEQQVLPDDCRLEIIVVDDGSGDDTPARLRRHAGSAKLLALPENGGRAQACNAGANLARGKYLLFLDCDCLPVHGDFLARHLHALRSTGQVASCGPVPGVGGDFWARYQEDVAARRAKQHASGNSSAASSANLVLRTHAFLQIGGFDVRYRTYGFEDRDLLLRLAAVGTIGWCANAVAIHHDLLTLPKVLHKMRLAGGASSALFSRQHADAYAALGYAAIDARLHPWLRPVSSAFRPLSACAATLERWLQRPWFPYPAAKAMVKLLSALAFMRGSAEYRR